MRENVSSSLFHSSLNERSTNENRLRYFPFLRSHRRKIFQLFSSNFRRRIFSIDVKKFLFDFSRRGSTVKNKTMLMAETCWHDVDHHHHQRLNRFSFICLLQFDRLEIKHVDSTSTRWALLHERTNSDSTWISRYFTSILESRDTNTTIGCSRLECRVSLADSRRISTNFHFF